VVQPLVTNIQPFFICICAVYIDKRDAEKLGFGSSLFQPERIFASIPTPHQLLQQLRRNLPRKCARKCVLSLPFIMLMVATDVLADQFLFKMGIYRVPEVCGLCGGPTTRMKNDRNTLQWRCSKKARHEKLRYPKGKMWSASAKKGTFLSKSKLPSNQFVMFVYFWLGDAPMGKIEQYLGCGNKTAGDWNCFLNEFVTLMVTKQLDDAGGKIGG
jgi:hypothetical protein